MNLRRLRAVTRKEWIQIGRDRLSLAFAFLMPINLIFLFGYAITLDVTHIRTAVCDRDRSSASRGLVERMTAGGYFSVEGVGSAREGETRIASGRARVYVEIPLHFGRDLALGRPAAVQAILDGSDSNTASIALGYLSGLLQRPPLGPRGPARLDLRVRYAYNPDLKSRNSIVPGLIAVIMVIVCALLTSMTMAREWERGTMEQLIATPVTRGELIVGKLTPYLVIGLSDMVLAAAMGVWIFGVPLRGSPLLLLLASVVFMVGGLGLGILISVTAKNQVIASQMAIVGTFLPAFLLSGFMFSTQNMPLPMQAVSRLVPARYFVTILKGIFLKGAGVRELWPEGAALVVMGALILALAFRKFRKRIGE